MGFPLLIWLDYSDSCNEGRLANIYLKVFLLLAGLLAGLSVGYVRVMLGVHTVCQVVLGWVIGLWTAFIVHFLVRPRFKLHMKDLLACKATNYKIYLVAITISFVIFNATSLILYAVLDSHYIKIETEWLEQITAKGCGDKIDGGFQILSLVELGRVNAFFGAYYGILL